MMVAHTEDELRKCEGVRQHEFRPVIRTTSPCIRYENLIYLTSFSKSHLAPRHSSVDRLENGMGWGVKVEKS